MTHIMLGDVFVRVDDLDARERERVAAAKWLITGITGRDGRGVFLGLVTAGVVLISLLIGLLVYGFNDPSRVNWEHWVIMGVATAMAGAYTYAGALAIFRKRQMKDLFDLETEVKLSPRCRELLDAYLAVHPEFGKFLPQELLKSQTV